MIYDSYVNLDDIELFLCNTNVNDLHWFRKEDIPEEVYQEYKNKKTIGNSRTCNTDKTTVFNCDLKCKTRGLQLACSNCGIVLAFRELYGSESLTQVALMYLDIVDNFKGIIKHTKVVLIYFNLKNFN